MPLPYALDHINLWALDDGDGWAIVDTGVRTDDTALAWRELFANAPDRRPLTRVFVTHMHPDHVGMAGWLTRKFGVRLWMTRLEYLTCRVMVSDTGREAPPDAHRVLPPRRLGRGGDRDLPRALRQLRQAHPRAARQLPPPARRRGAAHRRARRGASSSAAAIRPSTPACTAPTLKLLISGDQVLPRISSNVSVYPIEPDADPMADWLASLAKLKREVPDDVLVLPAHNECFRGLHARIDALARGQERALERLRRIARPSRGARSTSSARCSPAPIGESRRAAARHGHRREPRVPELPDAPRRGAARDRRGRRGLVSVCEMKHP